MNDVPFEWWTCNAPPAEYTWRERYSFSDCMIWFRVGMVCRCVFLRSFWRQCISASRAHNPFPFETNCTDQFPCSKYKICFSVGLHKKGPLLLKSGDCAFLDHLFYHRPISLLMYAMLCREAIRDSLAESTSHNSSGSQPGVSEGHRSFRQHKTRSRVSNRIRCSRKVYYGIFFHILEDYQSFIDT